MTVSFYFWTLDKLFSFRLCPRWRENVSRMVFQRKCDTLQDMLLIAAPQFRHALVLLTG